LIGGEFANEAYPPKFAADLARAGLAWPGPPDDDLFDEARAGGQGIDLDTWTEQTERFADFFLEGMRHAVARADWDLFLGYVPSLDEAGHRLLLVDPRQPGYTPALAASSARARRRIWQAVDRGLARLLAALDLSTTTVVLVSDHGMLPIHTRIDLNALLRDLGLAVLGDDGRPDPARSRALAPGKGERPTSTWPHRSSSPSGPRSSRDSRSASSGWRSEGIVRSPASFRTAGSRRSASIIPTAAISSSSPARATASTRTPCRAAPSRLPPRPTAGTATCTTSRASSRSSWPSAAASPRARSARSRPSRSQAGSPPGWASSRRGGRRSRTNRLNPRLAGSLRLAAEGLEQLVDDFLELNGVGRELAELPLELLRAGAGHGAARPRADLVGHPLVEQLELLERVAKSLRIHRSVQPFVPPGFAWPNSRHLLTSRPTSSGCSLNWYPGIRPYPLTIRSRMRMRSPRSIMPDRVRFWRG